MPEAIRSANNAKSKNLFLRRTCLRRAERSNALCSSVRSETAQLRSMIALIEAPNEFVGGVSIVYSHHCLSGTQPLKEVGR
jgi:hypothetical protein